MSPLQHRKVDAFLPSMSVESGEVERRELRRLRYRSLASARRGRSRAGLERGVHLLDVRVRLRISYATEWTC